MGKVYETKNQQVATFCVYAGLVLLEVKRAGAKTLLFVFDDPEGEGPKLDEQYFSDDSITSARALLRCADEVRKAVGDLYRSEKHGS